MRQGKQNISVGLLMMAAFMAFGFLLIYLRDFAPDKAQWIADYAVGAHFEARLAHVHGNLFGFLNIVIGYLIWQLPVPPVTATWVSRLALVGLLMPLGIVAELAFGAPPFFVLVGAIAMVAAVAMLGVAVTRLGPASVRA